MVSLHARGIEPGRARNLLAELAPAWRGRVEHARGGWTSVHLESAAFEDAARVARAIAAASQTDVVVAQAGSRALRMRHARDGAWCCDAEGGAQPDDGPSPAIGMPGRSGALGGRARAFVEAMQRQQDAEIASNAEWLRRHAGALDLEPPQGDALGRAEEAALMRRALAALRRAPSDPLLHAARHELDERLAREREAFHELTDAHRDLLGLSAIPDPASSSDAYFASVMDAVGRLAVESLAAGADPLVPPDVARHVRELGLSPDRLLARMLPPSPFAWIS